MARRSQRGSGGTATATRPRAGGRDAATGIIPQLAKAVREVENAVRRGPLRASGRTTFQVVALLVREERARTKADKDLTEAQRTEQLKRLDGVATILARTAARDTSLLVLLRRGRRRPARGPRAAPRDAARRRRRGGAAARRPRRPPPPSSRAPERRVVPQSVVSRQLSNPFMEPDFSAVGPVLPGPGQLGSWELLGPLFRSFEEGGASCCMDLPEPASLQAPGGRELMPHQAQVVAAAAAGHRTFLLADEPGLGKTAQALLAAQAADAYPLLVVVPERRQDQLGPRGRSCGAPSTARRSSTGTATTWTASPTSWSSTTRSSTGTSAGSATSASAGWSSTRRTSSRTAPRSAPATCCRSPTGSAPAAPAR